LVFTVCCNALQLHAKVRKNAMWGVNLQKFAWRIDVKSKARAVSEMNEPVAIVELTLGNKVRRTKLDASCAYTVLVCLPTHRTKRKRRLRWCDSRWIRTSSRTFLRSSIPSSTRSQLALLE